MDAGQGSDGKAAHRAAKDVGNGMCDTPHPVRRLPLKIQASGGADPSTETQKLFQTRPLNQTTTHDPKITT